MCGRTGMSWRRRSTPGSRTGSRGGDDRVCLRRGEGLRSFQGGRETWKTASWQPAGSRIRLPLKESDIPVAVNPKSADGPSNNPQCGFWDSQFSAAQVKSVEQPWVFGTGVEWAFAQNWTARVEYQYLGLDNVGVNNILVRDNFTIQNPNFQSVTLGINYLFNWGQPAGYPVVSRY